MARKKKNLLGPSIGHRILFSDPGGKAGYALYEGRDLVESGAVAGDDVHQIWDVFKRTAPDGLGIESQYIGVNPKTAMVIVRRRAYWETIALLLGLKVAEVPANIWQAWAKVKPGDKQAYYNLACAIVGRQLASQDEAAAVLIGMCYVASVPQA